MKSIFKKYYDLEKNFTIDFFWDRGYRIDFGDVINGFTSHHYCDTWDEVIEIFEGELKRRWILARL